MKRSLAYLLRITTFIEDQLGGLFLLFAAGLVFLQILVRAAGYSVGGLYEVAAFCAIWSIFLTAGVGIQRNIHVRVDILLLICPPAIAKTLRITSALAMIVMAGGLLFSGVLLVDESLTFGDRTLGTVRIPMWIPQIIMPLGGLLMLIHALVHLVEVLREPATEVTLDQSEAPLANINL